ncbi:hypothetical protein [Pleurocapsa sp. PCC 7319]|uniref:hypothetical protein n=1 Tax=Pleurocapsa sp. PCC 7319 TaxID=118161 RepID=UPI000348249D|nr:hypothetical protein [Pleurocapsa sp. PCC 7319]
MSKCHKWFRSLIEAVEKDPTWDIEPEKTASKLIPERAKQTKPRTKANNLIYDLKSKA